jgi:cyclophilin family peptidyl-prolyl cis-trans isomerase/HEAT repeat protein
MPTCRVEARAVTRAGARRPGARRRRVAPLLRAGALLVALLAPIAPVGAQRAAQRAALAPRDVALLAGLLRMADARRLDSALVDSALASPARAVRVQALLAVGNVHGVGRAGALRAALADRDTAVAATAAFALGLLRDTAALEPLAAALAGPAPTVAVEAAWALGELGEAARAAIAHALEVPARAPTVRAAALLAAARLRPVPHELVARFLAAPEAPVRWAATYAIARPRVAAGVRNLFPLVRDPDAGVRANVALALGKPVTGDSLGPPAREALRRLSGDRDRFVRTNAVRALATHGEAEQGPVLGGADDVDPNVRVAAAQAMRLVLRAESAEWDRLWEADTTWAVRRELLVGAARSGRDLPAAAAWATDADWRKRAAAVEALALRTPPEQRMAALAAGLADADGRVRATAVDQLAGVVDSVARVGPQPRERLAAFLADPDPVARANALAGMRAQARAVELPAYVAAYARARADTIADARRAALRALAAAWARDSANATPAQRAALDALPPTADPLEQREVATVGPLAAWRATPAVVPPLAHYDSLVRALVLPALAGRAPRARLVTERGAMDLALDAAGAPLTVANFVTLARRGLHGTRFHRIVPHFVVQDGDPRGDGNGGPGWAICDELTRQRYGRGVLGMALDGPDTGGSQWFITHAPQPHLDGRYATFGRVVAGERVLDALVQGDRLLRIEILP